jgi:hypothetical protein
VHPSQAWRGVQTVSAADCPLALLHWRWAVRQFATMGEFLDIMPAPPAVAARNRLLHASYYYLAAAQCAQRRHEALGLAHAWLAKNALFSLAVADVPAASVSPFLGQIAADFPIVPESGAAGAVTAANADALLSLRIVQIAVARAVAEELELVDAAADAATTSQSQSQSQSQV